MLKFNRTVSWLLLLSAIGTCPSAIVWADPPVHPLVMDWVGEEGAVNRTGDGALDAWENWQGNSEFISANPTVINYYPPQDGDFLRMQDLLLWGGVQHSITGGSIVADVGLQIALYATFTGGTLDVGGISITASGFSTVFNGTWLGADMIQAVASDNDEIEFNNAEIIAGTLELSGAKAVDSDISANVITVSPYGSPVETNIQQSTVAALGAQIGFGPDPEVVAPMLLDDHTSAHFDQFLIVGSTNSARLTVSNSSTVDAPDAYVNVGDFGRGELFVTQSSGLRADELNVGVHGEGSVGVDSDNSLIRSHAGVLGVSPGSQGTVNIENNGAWETGSLIIGDDGIGYVYVRDGGTLTVDGDTVLGLQGVGRLLLIGNQTATLAPPLAEFDGSLILYNGSVSVEQEAVLHVVDELYVGASTGVVIEGAGAELRVDRAAEVNGDLTFRNRGRGQILQKLQLEGAVWVAGTPETGGALTIGEQSSLAPIGTVQLNHRGVLSGESGYIGGDLILNDDSLWGGDDDFGDWDISGDVTIEEGGGLALNIGGVAPEDHDVINVGGAAVIDGKVVLKFVDGFAPSVGNSFSLIVGSNLQVNPTIEVRNLAPGWQYSVTQAGGAWTVTSLGIGVATKPADFNGDGSVNASDLATFGVHFGMTDGAMQGDGDSDSDFDVDGDDFLNWQRQLDVAAIVAANEPVPEPSCLAMALLAGWGWALRRARGFNAMTEKSVCGRGST